MSRDPDYIYKGRWFYFDELKCFVALDGEWMDIHAVDGVLYFRPKERLFPYREEINNAYRNHINKALEKSLLGE